jgi:hypothetical protein
MDFEATIEFYLRRLEGYNTRIEKILVDPFQMHRTITTLQAAGLPIEPFPQTQSKLILVSSRIARELFASEITILTRLLLRHMHCGRKLIAMNRALPFGNGSSANALRNRQPSQRTGDVPRPFIRQCALRQIAHRCTCTGSGKDSLS